MASTFYIQWKSTTARMGFQKPEAEFLDVIGTKVFWAPNGPRLYRLDAISQDPKKLSLSRAKPPPTCPRNGCCPHQKHHARGRINHRCINSKNIVYRNLKSKNSLKIMPRNLNDIARSWIRLLASLLFISERLRLPDKILVPKLDRLYKSDTVPQVITDKITRSGFGLKRLDRHFITELIRFR